MTETEQNRFDTWWYLNRTSLINAYSEEIDLNMATLLVAEKAWKGAMDAKNNTAK